MPTNQHPIRAFLKIQSGEEIRAVGMFLYSLLAIGGVILIGREAGRVLFLSQLPESATPYRYILPPLVIVPVLALYTRLVPRYRLNRLILGTGIVMAAGILAFRMLLDGPTADQFSTLAGMYIYLQVVATIVGIQFWTYANDIFTPREARRLFALIAVGGTLANVVAGAVLRLVAGFINPKDLLLIMTGGLLGSLVVVAALRRRRIGELSDNRKTPGSTVENASLRSSIAETRRSRLLLTASAMMLTISLVTNIAAYQLDLSLQRFFTGNAQGMIAFMGSFNVISGILALVMQLFVTSRLLGRAGLLVGLLVLPFAHLAGSTALILSAGAMWAAALPRGADYVFRYTVNDSALNILFLPVSPGLRRRAKAVVEGMMKPSAIAILGLLFLLFQRDDIDRVGVQAIDVVPWSAVALALVGLWFWLISRIRQHYTAALTASLQRRRLDLEGATIDATDDTTRQVLLTALQSADHLQVIHALNLMAAAPEVDWSPHILPLLRHPTPEVRLVAVRFLGRKGEHPYTREVAHLFTDADEAVRSAAIESFCASCTNADMQQVMGYLDSPTASIQGATVLSLIKYGDLDNILHAAPYLRKLLDNSDPMIRATGADVLGRLGVRRFYEPLIELLDDPNQEVRLKAIRAAGRVAHPQLLPLLLNKLADPALAAATSEALSSFGNGIEAALGAALAGHHNPAVRAQVPRVLQRIYTPASAAVLLKHLHEPDNHLRARIYQALSRLQAQGVSIVLDEAAAHQALQEEIYQAYYLSVVYQDLGEEGRRWLLGTVLTEHRNYALDRLFFLLDLLHPQRNLLLARQALSNADPRRRAYAIELVDTIAGRQLRELLVPLVEAPVEQIAQFGVERFAIPRQTMIDRLGELAGHPQPWVRACTLYNISRLPVEELAAVLPTATNDEADIVRETAALLYSGRFNRHTMGYL